MRGQGWVGGWERGKARGETGGGGEGGIMGVHRWMIAVTRLGGGGWGVGGWVTGQLSSAMIGGGSFSEVENLAARVTARRVSFLVFMHVVPGFFARDRIACPTSKFTRTSPPSHRRPPSAEADSATAAAARFYNVERGEPREHFARDGRAAQWRRRVARGRSRGSVNARRANVACSDGIVRAGVAAYEVRAAPCWPDQVS